jgi:DNA-directed DNA polymerase III PolC
MPVSLHTHSWYSLLEGVSSPEALLRRAVAGGYTALALTDTNNLCGAVPFVALAARHGVRPLLGACLRQGRSHCVALIAERVGYRNLCRILSRLHLAAAAQPEDATDTPPPILHPLSSTYQETDLPSLLCANPEGLHVLVDEPALAERLREAFGRRLWLELIRPRSGGPARHEDDLLACGRRLGVRAVASTTAHFAGPAEHATFRLLRAVRRGTLLDQLPAALPVTPEHHLVSADDFRHRFSDVPSLVRHGEELAELLRSDVLPRDVVLPRPRLRRSLEPAGYLRALCERGLRERGLGADLTARQRLREELAIIEPADLAGYFLTVRDIARVARRGGHGMALRGSAGCSLVCYLLAITDVNPLRFGLEPERFLHPGRADLPDIDLDFDWKVRDRIIDSVIRRYGPAHVARISSHLFFQPRSAFREAGKVHGLSDEQVSALLGTLSAKVDDLLLPEPAASALGGEPGASATGGTPPPPVADAPGSPSSWGAPPGFPLEPERWPRLLADARRLLGRPHLLSLHPGGILITPQPIEDYVPLQWAAKGVLMTQFDKDGVEQVGLVKIDLLGNRALSTVDEARGHAHLAPPPTDEPDPATVALLCRGDTLGITQLESPAMRHLVLQMQPQSVEDIIQALALLRPGAAGIGVKERFIRRRLGLEPVQVAHPALAALLGETHGLMLYEDDALRLVQALTGLPAADADRFRKRVSKHETAEQAQALQAEFLGLCARQGVPAEAVAELWAQLAKFNRYSFCKSHAVSYGLIAWQAAYLKAHHPVSFWTAALNNNQGAYPRRVYIEAIKRAGIELRLPCVNHSRGPFTLEDEAIRTGLGAIAGLPQEVRGAVIAERDQHPYADLADLRRRVPLGPEALALLIRCGALDFTGRSRPALFLEADLQGAPPNAEELFVHDPTEGWAPDDYPPRRRLRDEWQALGFVLGPPLFALFRSDAAMQDGPPLIESRNVHEHAGRRVRVQGLVATGRHVFTEDGRPIQFVTLEDEHGLIEVTLFPGSCAQVPYLTIGPYVATGAVEERHGAYTVTAERFERAGR